MKRRKIKDKIIISLGLSIVILMIISTFMISNIIERNTRTFIENDMKIIVKYTRDEINNMKKREEDNFFHVMNIASKTFNCYIGLNKEYYEAVGEIFIEEKIKKYKNSNEKIGMLSVNKIKDTVIGTLYFPLEINDEFQGNLVIQKSYKSNFDGDEILLTGLIFIEIMITIMLLVGTYVIVSISTKPLEELAKAIRQFGERKKVEKLENQSVEEIQILSDEFDKMQKNIEDLQKTTRDFFDKATHELKTPITAIKGYTQLLQDEGFEDDFINRALERMELESFKMEELVEKLLILSREELEVEKEKEQIKVKDIIKNILVDFDITVTNNNIKINIKLESEIKVEVLRDDLETIIKNLIDNSIKYSSDREIEIELNKNSFKISNFYNPKYLNIKENLLEPFVKGSFKKGEVSSSGLGLYICKRISEKNNWSLEYHLDEKLKKIFFEINF